MPATDQCSLRPRAGGAQGKGGASGLQWHVPRAANVSRRVGAGVWGRSGWGPPRGKSNVGRWEVKLFGLVQLCSFKSHPPAPEPLSLPRPAQPELPTVGPSHCVIGQPSSQRSTEGKSAAHRHPGRSKGKRRAEAPERARRCGSRLQPDSLVLVVLCIRLLQVLFATNWGTSSFSNLYL